MKAAIITRPRESSKDGYSIRLMAEGIDEKRLLTAMFDEYSGCVCKKCSIYYNEAKDGAFATHLTVNVVLNN